MKAFVTGANGLVGSHLAARLCELGCDVRCLVREGSDAGRLTAIASPRLSIVRGGLVDAQRVREAIDGAEVVFHVAASLRGAPADLFRDAVVMTRNLLEAAASLPRCPKVVLVSSFSVYFTARPSRRAVLDERTPLEPRPELRDAYAQAKLRQEQLAWSYHLHRGVPLAVVRPGVVYGGGASPVTARVGFRAGPLFLLLGGANVVPLSHVANCADAIATVGASRGTVGWAFNVHDDDLPTGRELAAALARREGVTVVPVPPPATRAAAAMLARYAAYSKGQLPAPLTPYRVASLYGRWRFDNRRLKSLGWKPRVATAEGLAAAFA